MAPSFDYACFDASLTLALDAVVEVPRDRPRPEEPGAMALVVPVFIGSGPLGIDFG